MKLPYHTSENDEEYNSNIDELVFMYGYAQNSLCLLRCKEDRFTEVRPPLKHPKVFDEFMKRTPYRYLQYCYWKQGDLPNAIKAAYTYLTANPREKEALDNVAFYMEQPGYVQEMLVDRLQMKFEAKYMSGVVAYKTEDWQTCMRDLSDSMEEYFNEIEKCRTICEDELNWESIDGLNPEMSIVLTSVYMSVLRCKNDCPSKLSRVNGREINGLLASYFDYLHVCQFKSNYGRDACQSVANSLLLQPNNPIMRRNRLFYSTKYSIAGLFKPSKNVIEFHRRDVLEKRFISFVDERFKYEDGRLVPERADDRKPFDRDVWMEDNFDYSQLQVELINEMECTALRALSAFYVGKMPPLAQEIQHRIRERYQTQPEFESLSCSKMTHEISCAERSFILSLDKIDCGGVMLNL
ncbi:hypothetical protein AB6A40_007756, partial [Gnathostoma spinigerum]